MAEPRNASRFWRDRDLPGIEVRYSRHVGVALGRHTHDSYSVGVVTEGRTIAFMDGHNVPIRKGQIALVRPHEVHSCNPRADSPFAYWMFHVDGDWLHALTQDLSGRADARPVFASSIVDDPSLCDALQRLGLLVTRGAGRIEKESAAAAAFGGLIARHCRVAEKTPGAKRRAVRLVQEYIDGHLTQNVGLQELARVAGLSRYHLLRVFKESTGLPPHAWRTQRRLHAARRLLSSGMPIADAALESGFADQSHLSHWFKRMVGTTPWRYLSARGPQ